MRHRRIRRPKANIMPLLLTTLAAVILAPPLLAQDQGDDNAAPHQRGNELIAAYFEEETRKLEDRPLATGSADDWRQTRQRDRRRLREMLGLHPMPERTDLNPVVTGTVERDGVRVEKLHFQSRPGLYVTANLYLPADANEDAELPAVLYVCGHARVKEDGISYGNKVGYQHHGAWFARHGYACLLIDTIQLGEIEGMHHGTYRHGRWWWNARGYTPAGVEAWNGIRAIDYLQQRPEVDPDRIGVTGRSGGGAYSWWIATLDQRVKAAVPVAGITDLRNHVVDGVVEGHCDCMYTVNTYRWDYDRLASLVAPRPLLLSNSDKDSIFPLDGVVRVHRSIREVYELLDAADNLGLHLTEGPHSDTQELRVGAFSWMNRHLKDNRPLIEQPARDLFEPDQLKVFDQIPDDQINTEISKTFVPAAEIPDPPADQSEWIEQRDRWRSALLRKSFRGWPDDPAPLNVQKLADRQSRGLALRVYQFTSQHNVPLRLYLVHSADLDQPRAVSLRILDQEQWEQHTSALRSLLDGALDAPTLPDADTEAFDRLREKITASNNIHAYLAPRGIGATAWSPDERDRTHIRRRFMLLGQTLDGMRVWDVRRAVQALRSTDEARGLPLTLRGRGTNAGLALYASLFEPYVARLDLHNLPTSHRDGPIFLNVLRYLDTPQALAMAAERCHVQLRTTNADLDAWQYPRAVAENLGWSDRLRVTETDAAED